MDSMTEMNFEVNVQSKKEEEEEKEKNFSKVNHM